MKVIGLTGGIGSGKTTVANMFIALGIPVYIADVEAKKLMNNEPTLQKKIIKLLGSNAYRDGKLNRQFIADTIFNDKEVLKKMNAIIHPAVANHFEDWKNSQRSAYVIKEAAILFENQGYKQCDYTILVVAPQEIRIKRVQKRDHSTRKEILDRIKNQWGDAKKKQLADFVIKNVKLEETKYKINEIHKIITQN